MIHHFYESQKTEIAHFDTADSFYRGRLGALEIHRCDYHTPKGREFQQEDIDLWLRLENRSVSVSEKKRTHDFDDLYLETYSKFPDVTGWTIHSKADFLAYFFPKRVFWAGFPQIVRFYREQLLPRIPKRWYEELRKNDQGKSGKEEHKLTVAGSSYFILLIQAYNESTESSWYTMGISFPFALLKDNHIKFEIFPVKGLH